MVTLGLNLGRGYSIRSIFEVFCAGPRSKISRNLELEVTEI
jgi:hypothetical protein